jgi:hypothetical protein
VLRAFFGTHNLYLSRRIGKMKPLVYAWVLASALAPGAAVAQATSPPAVISLREELLRDGKAAAVRPRITILYNSWLNEISGCTVTVIQIQGTEYTRDSTISVVRLSDMSPEVKLDPFGDSSTSIGIRALASNGDTVISQQSVLSFPKSDDRRPQSRSFKTRSLVFVSDAKDAAERIRLHLSTAIRACGGKPITAVAKATFDSISRSESVEVAAQAVADTINAKLKSSCRDRVASQLYGPSTAVFTDEEAFGKLSDTTMMVMGKVEGQNRLGGRIQKSYICSFVKYGNSWIVQREPSIF